MPTTLKSLLVEKQEKPILIKVTPSEYKDIKEKADKYARGNVSSWLRYAGTLDPREQDLVTEGEDENRNN